MNCGSIHPRKLVLPGTSYGPHLFYILLPDIESRTDFLSKMNDIGVNCVFHYVPLHSSPARKIYGKASGKLEVTNDISERLVRLPLYPGMSFTQIDTIVNKIFDFFND